LTRREGRTKYRRLIDAYRGGLSLKECGSRFGFSKTFVHYLIRRFAAGAMRKRRRLTDGMRVNPSTENGRRAGSRRLTPREGRKKYRRIINAYRSGLSLQECSDKLGVSKTFVHYIIRRFARVAMRKRGAVRLR
jgi:transposase